MSSDGLLFKCLSTVNEKTKTPVLATVFCGIGTGKEFNAWTRSNIYTFVLSKLIFQACCRPCSISNNLSRWRLLARSCRIWWFASVFWYSGVCNSIIICIIHVMFILNFWSKLYYFSTSFWLIYLIQLCSIYLNEYQRSRRRMRFLFASYVFT